MPPLRYRLLAAPLRLFFKLLYHQLAWTYDWVAAAVSVGFWKAWVRSVIPYIEGPRVLELGHGPGHLQIALKGLPGGAPFQVFGLDRSKQMGRQAARRLQRAGYSAGLTNGLAQALPFPSGTFHSVVSTFPSEYIFQRETLPEVWRVLAPGGKFVVLPLAWITGRRLPERLAALLFRVTGEAPLFHDRSLDPLRQMGFETRSEYVKLPSSRLLIIEACKPREAVNQPGLPK
jgi:ubiquinone/menaquinone biosynthesis C-methylase UbiE